MNTELLFLNFPQEYFKKLVSDKRIDNVKAYKDGSFRLIRGENDILVSYPLFLDWAAGEGIKVPDHKHLVRMVEYCVEQLKVLDNRQDLTLLN